MPIKKLSDLRPCDHCGGALGQMFITVRVSQTMIDAQEANRVLGTSLMFGHQSLYLAETFCDENVVSTLGDENPELMTEILLCHECFYGNDFNLCVLVDKENRSKISG